jgi:hypothetical protein
MTETIPQLLRIANYNSSYYDLLLKLPLEHAGRMRGRPR